MFKNLLNFELYYQFKQSIFIVLALAFTIIGFAIGAFAIVQKDVFYNSSYKVGYYAAFIGIGIIFAIIFFVIPGVLRDKQYRADSLIFSTKIKKWQYFLSRFIGVFSFSLGANTFFFIGAFIGSLYYQTIEPSKVGDFSFMAYFWPWLIIIVPNVFIWCSLIFSVCIISKSNIMTYIISTILFVAYLGLFAAMQNLPMVQSDAASLTTSTFKILINPSGISAFMDQSKFWSIDDMNTKLLSLSGKLLWNRLLWFGISIAILFISYRLFSFRKVHQKRKLKIKKTKDIVVKALPYHANTIQLGSATDNLAFFSMLKLNLRSIFKTLHFKIIIVFWFFFMLFSLVGVISEYHLYPATNILIGELIIVIIIICPLLLVFYSGELVEQERQLDFDGIIDATPTKNMTFYFSKLITLLTLPFLLIGTTIVFSILFQLANGYSLIEFGQYLMLFAIVGIPMLFYGILTFFIQSLVHNKYLGMGISALIIFACLTPTTELWHPLTRIGRFPVPFYINFNGYLGALKPFMHFSFYWLALGGVLSILSFKLWQRGISAKLKFRMTQLFSNWNRKQLLSISLLLILFISSGATIFYNTNVVEPYKNQKDIIAKKQAYDTKYKSFKDLEALDISSIKTNVDIYPTYKTYTIKADYILINNNEQPIAKMLLSERLALKSIALEQGKIIEYDSLLGAYIFEFSPPIAPQQRLKFTYELSKTYKGYETYKSIIKNGSYIGHKYFEPIMGYQKRFDYFNEFVEGDKQETNLLKGKLNKLDATKITFETIVSTQEGQIALSSGNLLKEWTENGRHYFHFKSSEHINANLAYFSAEYKIKKEDIQGVSIENYYQPSHLVNINRVSELVSETVKYLNKNFEAYPFQHIRIAELPFFWDIEDGRHPGLIGLTENRIYNTDASTSEDINIIANRILPEVIRQYWMGNDFINNPILAEGFSKYVEAEVMTEMEGMKSLWHLGREANKSYFASRLSTGKKEFPLYLDGKMAQMVDGKIYSIMRGLDVLLGKEKMNSILKSFSTTQKDSLGNSVKPLDFLDRIYLETIKPHHQLLDSWFKKVIIYDFAIRNTDYTKTKDGKFKISLEVISQRFETRNYGEDFKLDINEPIQIGVFNKHPKDIENDDAILYLKSHSINDSKMNFEIIVDSLPKYISIDPFCSRMDKNLENNLKALAQ